MATQQNKRIRTILSVFISFIFLFCKTSSARAKATSMCEDRYLTLVNPVRDRNLWAADSSLKPIRDQYSLVKKNDFPATWLLQYDALTDNELTGFIKNGFDKRQELGLFLEISKNLALDSYVDYPGGFRWSNPQVIFLSSYTPKERKRMIDTLFKTFKDNFGYYPLSVGAWWIDSYSLNYMKDRYKIRVAMIVADQKITDDYGVWGQWWGVPYYPSRANILTPASSLKNKEDIVVVQWAQRHPELAYGGTGKYSTNSLQANDYLSLGKDTSFFKELINIYLDCRNSLGQVTVGLETGMESVGYSKEYGKQLDFLKQLTWVKPVTMTEFADQFSKVYPEFPKEFRIKGSYSEWLMTPGYRQNKEIGDSIKYNPNISFKDHFLAEHSDFLDRRLTSEYELTDNTTGQLTATAILLSFFIFAFLIKDMKLWLIGALFIFCSFGLILRSSQIYGWNIFYGPYFSNIETVKTTIIILSTILFLSFWKLSKIKNIILLPLGFGLDGLIEILRFSLLSGKYYFGFLVGDLRFIGMGAGKDLSLGFINQVFMPSQANALLRIDIFGILRNVWISLLIYPLIHIIFAIVIAFLAHRIGLKVKITLLIVLIIGLILHIVNIFGIEPSLVEAAFKNPIGI